MGGGLGLLVLLLLVWCLGGDPLAFLQNAPQAPSSEESPAPAPPAEDEEAQFVSAILASTEDAWSSIFAENGASYPAPRLVLFADIVRSARGPSGSNRDYLERLQASLRDMGGRDDHVSALWELVAR